MEYFVKVLNSALPYIAVAMAIIIVILFIMILVAFKALGNLEKKYKKFMRDTKGDKSIEELVIDYLDKVDNSVKATNDAISRMEKLKVMIDKCLQRFSILRYKAFDDVGSDLSFSIALLDSKNDGMIITGIYGRQDSTTYAKPIANGVSKYDLSEEEKHVLKDAMNK